MKTTPKQTKRNLELLQAKEEATRLGLDPYSLIDIEDKISTTKAKKYSVEMKDGSLWYIDETNDTALNINDGTVVEIATFQLLLKKANSKDSTFTSNLLQIDDNDIANIMNEIKASDYISEIVRTSSETMDGSTTNHEDKIIVWNDSENVPNMLKIELSKRTDLGADLFAFSEPKILLQKGLSNNMLYYTDDKETVLNYLGFEMLSNSKWYNPEKNIIANIGDYNFFKQPNELSKVNTSKSKNRNELLAM